MGSEAAAVPPHDQAPRHSSEGGETSTLCPHQLPGQAVPKPVSLGARLLKMPHRQIRGHPRHALVQAPRDLIQRAAGLPFALLSRPLPQSCVVTFWGGRQPPPGGQPHRSGGRGHHGLLPAAGRDGLGLPHLVHGDMATTKASGRPPIT